jgi:Zn finger protein HypA/HybF involved in hydrogenase expression
MKSTTTEDQHVREHELRHRLEVLEAEQRATAENETLQLKELHWMHCPKCGQELMTETYRAVEIDLCPSCRGLWLDANELETIMTNDSAFLQSCLNMLQGR